MHNLLSGMEMWMCMVGQLSPKGRFKPYYGEWLIIDESIPNQLERIHHMILDWWPSYDSTLL